MPRYGGYEYDYGQVFRVHSYVPKWEQGTHIFLSRAWTRDWWFRDYRAGLAVFLPSELSEQEAGAQASRLCIAAQITGGCR